MEIKCWINNTGDIYEGQYSIINDYNVLDGFGTIIFYNGYKLEGYFTKGVKHGPFQITDMNKKNVKYVVFDNDIIRRDDNNNISEYGKNIFTLLPSRT